MREVEAKRRILDAYEQAVAELRQAREHEAGTYFADATSQRHAKDIRMRRQGRVDGLKAALRLLALPYAAWPGYRAD
jgi:hypothetical protein